MAKESNLCLREAAGDGKISPDRPLAYEYDFIEVFAGAAVITTEMSQRGCSKVLPMGPCYGPLFVEPSGVCLKVVTPLCSF